MVTGVIGFACGVVVGVGLMCMMFAASEADDEYERYRRCKDMADEEDAESGEEL